MVDLTTDALFCLSLASDGDSTTYSRPLMYVSAALMASSLLLNLCTTLGLYFRRARLSGQLQVHLFALSQPSSDRAAYFFLVLAAALFNPRLCKLLPWTSQARPDVEAQILKIFLLSRCSEDLPQLIVAATYLGLGGGTTSGDSLAALLQLIVSGTSFVLLLLFLCLQLADTSIASQGKGLNRQPTLSGKLGWQLSATASSAAGPGGGKQSTALDGAFFASKEAQSTPRMCPSPRSGGESSQPGQLI